MDSLQKPFSISIVAVVVLVALASVTPFAAAQSSQPAWADGLFRNSEDMVEEFNGYYGRTPVNRAGQQLFGEKVNLVITDRNSGETVTFSFRVHDQYLQIRDLDPRPRDDATLKMSTDRATIERINAADEPGKAYQNALDNGDIKVSGISLVNKVKWTTINIIGSVIDRLT